MLDPQTNFSGVGVPSPATLASFANETVDDTASVNNGAGLTAGEYLIASVSYTNERCDIFFDTLEKFKQDSEFLDEVLTALVAAGSPIAAFSASAETLAKISSGILFANQINASKADIYAFAAYKEQLKAHVLATMADFQAQKGLNLLQQARVGVTVFDPDETGTVTVRIRERAYRLNAERLQRFFESREVSDLLIARGVAANYSSLCSLANMRKIVASSLENTTSKIAEPAADGGIGAPAAIETVAAPSD